MKNIHWERKVNPAQFYPRCFDLSESEDRENFFFNFKLGKIISFLKNYLLRQANLEQAIQAFICLERHLNYYKNTQRTEF